MSFLNVFQFNSNWCFSICQKIFVLIISTAIIAFLSVVSCFSQGGKQEFEHISINQGLSSSYVTCIFQDSKGFIWFGTLNGLNKYDGNKLTTYVNNPEDSSSLSQSTIHAIYEDNKGKLWIGTEAGGLNEYCRETERFTQHILDFNMDNKHSENHIKSIIEDKSGSLWIGTYGGGLIRYDNDRTSYSYYINNKDNPSSLSSDYINVVYIDKADKLWIGSWRGGLSSFDPVTEQFTNYTIGDTDLGNTVNSIIEDEYGNLWVGTWGGGLIKFDRKKEKWSNQIFENAYQCIGVFKKEMLLRNSQGIINPRR